MLFTQFSADIGYTGFGIISEKLIGVNAKDSVGC